VFLSAMYPVFSLVLHRKGIMEGLGGKDGSVCEEFEDNEGGIYWVNVSESSDTASSGLSRLTGR